MPASSLRTACRHAAVVALGAALLLTGSPAGAATTTPGASPTHATVAALESSTAIRAKVTVATKSSQVRYGTSAKVVVAVHGGSPAPSGAVRAYYRGRSVAVASVQSGRATLRLPATWKPGKHSVSVKYLGDARYTPATKSQTVTITRTSSTVKTASAAVRFGAGAKVRVRVQGAGSTPTGTVRVLAGTKVLGARTLSRGYAVVSLPKSLNVGTRKLTVKYSGSSKHGASRGTVTSRIVKAAPTVSAKTTSVTTKQRSRVSVSVKAPVGVATGTVAVTRSGKTYGTARLASGRASIALPVLKAGSYTFSAAYRGSANLSARSTSVRVRVSTAPATRPPAPTYANCTDVWNRLGRSIRAFDRGFRAKFDRDGDGVGCEVDPR